MEEENIVFRNKGMRAILIYLLKQDIGYAAKISKKTKYSTCGVGREIVILEKIGLVKRFEYKTKRNKKKVNKLKKYYKITEEGKEIARLLIKINLIKYNGGKLK